jgi:hypothetical protein
MTRYNAQSRARIIIRIQELAQRLGALSRELTTASSSRRPALEVGVNALKREIAQLSRQLR